MCTTKKEQVLSQQPMQQTIEEQTASPAIQMTEDPLHRGLIPQDMAPKLENGGLKTVAAPPVIELKEQLPKKVTELAQPGKLTKEQACSNHAQRQAEAVRMHLYTQSVAEMNEPDAPADFIEVMKYIASYASYELGKFESTVYADALTYAMEAAADYLKVHEASAERGSAGYKHYNSVKVYLDFMKATSGGLLMTGKQKQEASEAASKHEDGKGYTEYDRKREQSIQDASKEENSISRDYSKREPSMGFRGLQYLVGAASAWRDVRKTPLFAHEPSVTDIQQRANGDCYLLAALSSLVVNNPQAIKECMKDNGDGTVTVRFFENAYNEHHPVPKSDHLRNTLWMRLEDLPASDVDIMARFLIKDQSVGNHANALISDAEKKLTQIDKARLLRQMGDKPTVEELFKPENSMIRKAKLHAADITEQEQADKEALTAYITKMKLFNTYFSADYQGKETPLFEMAAALLKEPLMQEMVNKVREISKRPPEENKPQPDLTDALSEAMDLFAATDAETLKKMALPHQKTRQTMEDPMHPVYVTVQKTIPRIVGLVDSFNAGNLWVQMIEKAYACSYLHDSTHLNENAAEIRKRYTRADGTQTRKQQDAMNRKLEKLYTSYEAIQGGNADTFLTTLTGKRAASFTIEVDSALELHDQEKEFVTLLSGHEDVLGLPRTNLTKEQEKRLAEERAIREKRTGVKESDPIAIDVNALMNSVFRTLMKKEYHEKTVRHGFLWLQSTHVKYGTHGLTVEEITDTVREQLKNVPGGAELLQNAERLSVFMSGVSLILGMSEKYHHRPFTRDENGNAVYNYKALEAYQNIQDALDRKRFVAAGSKTYLPELISSGGLNGEALNQGIVEGHDYSIVGLFEENSIKYVRLHNPWSSGELNYEKKIKKDGTFEIVRKGKMKHALDRLNYSENRGVFNIELNDFMRSLDRVYIV